MELAFDTQPVKLFSLFTLLLFFLLSHRVVLSDIKTQKIPNALLLKYFKISIVACLAFLAYGAATRDRFVINYIAVIGINFVVSAFAGYALWHFDLWSPGDGKYFPMVAILLPLQFYQYQFVVFFPAVTILVNAYIIGFIAMFARTLYFIGRRTLAVLKGDKRSEAINGAVGRALSAAKDPRYLANTAAGCLYMVSCLMIFKTVYGKFFSTADFSSPNLAAALMICMYFAGVKVMRLISANKMARIGSMIVFACALAFKWLFLGQDIARELIDVVGASIFMIVIFPLARKIIDEYQRGSDTMLVENVKMGVALSEDTVKMFLEEKNVVVPANVELTDDEAQIVKDNFPNMMEVRRVSHITFGPFIFLGALFLMLFKKTIMHYLMSGGG